MAVSDSETPPWRDADLLEQEYVSKGKSMKELAEEWGCSPYTIDDWLREYDIRKYDDAPWRDKDTLVELYCERGLDTVRISERFGCDHKTISNWLKKHGIEIMQHTKRPGDWSGPAMFFTNHFGYEQWKHTFKGGAYEFTVHRLLAVSEYGVEAVKNNHVHHKNGIKWDNRPDNIEVVTPEEHAKIHYERGDLSGLLLGQV